MPKCRKNEKPVIAWSKPHPLTLENSTGQFLLYFQFDILLVLWHTIPEVFKQVLFGHCSWHSYGKHNNFFLSRNAPSHSAMISGDTLKMKGLSIFFRSSAPSQVTGMYTRIMTACSRFKSCAALFTALQFLFPLHDCYKNVFVSFVHRCIFYCTDLKFLGRFVYEKLYIYLTAATYLAPSVTSALISFQGQHYLCNLYPSVTLGWNGLRVIRNYQDIRKHQNRSEKGHRCMWIIWPFLALVS